MISCTDLPAAFAAAKAGPIRTSLDAKLGVSGFVAVRRGELNVIPMLSDRQSRDNRIHEQLLVEPSEARMMI
jgi:hypothetical protein